MDDLDRYLTADPDEYRRRHTGGRLAPEPDPDDEHERADTTRPDHPQPPAWAPDTTIGPHGIEIEPKDTPDDQ